MPTTKKLELRIELGDSYVPISTPVTPNNTLRSKKSADKKRIKRIHTGHTESSAHSAPKSVYTSKLGPAGSAVSGASIVQEQDNFPNTPVSRKQSRTSQRRAANLSRLFTPASTALIQSPVKTAEGTRFKASESPAFYSTIPTPFIRNFDSQANSHHVIAQHTPAFEEGDMGKKTTNKKVRIATEKNATSESRASVTTRTSPSTIQALKNLLDSIGKETENLSFKEMMEVKVALRMMSHISRDSLEDMTSFKSVLEELCMFWKINRLDLDLLEHLLMKLNLLEKFDSLLYEYKKLVDYDKLTASSERDVTTIVSTLHNLLQGSDDASGTYTTVSFLHYGDVYNFDRSRLKCVKSDLSKLLDILPCQITYLAKVSSGLEGYVTLLQMPVSITRRFLEQARINHPTLMSMGIKGMQITGSDGLRYTQSMGYLQEKVPAHTQTKETDFRMANRSAKTAPAGSSLPPLSRKTRAVASQNSYHNTLSRDQKFRPGKIETIREVDREETKEILKHNISKLYEKAMDTTMDPTEAKFERRVRLARDTLSQLTQEDQDGLVKVLLDQIQKLQRTVANLKRDLRDKTRDLNSSQNYVQKAQKELKSMEMKVETKAQEISKTNDHLLKRVKKLMNENTLLRETIEGQEVDLDLYRQSDRENTFNGLMRVRRVGRGKQPATARSTLATFA